MVIGRQTYPTLVTQRGQAQQYMRFRFSSPTVHRRVSRSDLTKILTGSDTRPTETET